MPILNKSIAKKEKEESHLIVTLPAESRKKLKELMKEWKQLKVEIAKPIDINENLSVSAWLEDLYFFYYNDPKNEKKCDFDYVYFGISEMSKKVKKQKLSDVEEILLATWNELNDSGYSSLMFESAMGLEPIKSELNRRAKMHREYQIKLEKFLCDISFGVLEAVKRQDEYELEDLFNSLIKGNTIEMW